MRKKRPVLSRVLVMVVGVSELNKINFEVNNKQTFYEILTLDGEGFDLLSTVKMPPWEEELINR